MAFLDMIDTPSDLKKVERDNLPEVAKELRDLILQTVSDTGGHLASSLGVVELTLALHYVFNSPEDRIVWDVGHQAYAHKILTGRREMFPTLRQKGGLSGFPKINESEHDAFGAGHSSTSVSAALGIATARDLDGEHFKVIAIIGDGSLSSGIALEGLNQAGDLKKDLIVVLNDNEWSISHNVGALSSYLNRIMTGKMYTGFRKRVEKLLKSIPFTGDLIAKAGRRVEELVKGLVVPGILFEELGYTYIGPIPGHSLEDLIVTLKNAHNFDGPVLIHVITKKGKGYRFAEENPERYHGVSPFHVEDGSPRRKKGKRSYTSVFSEEIVRLGKEDERIIAITAAMPGGTGLEKFGKFFPKRFFDVGICESHGVTFAAGLASRGKRPVVAIYSTFLQRAYDQIIHDVCLQNLPVLFALDRGGLVGADGPTHHGVFDLSYLRHVPNMSVMVPSDEHELQSMLRLGFAIPGPVAIRYPRGEVTGLEWNEKWGDLELGKSRTLKEGTDITLIAVGSCVQPSLEAAALLKKDGLSVRVVDGRFVKPLDAGMVEKSALETGKIVTIEENVLAGGFGSAVVEILSDGKFGGVEVLRLGIDDRFIEHGTQGELRALLGIDPEGIRKNALTCFYGKERERIPSPTHLKADFGKISR